MILLFVDPITTDDHFRYLWDGKVQSEGLNPYKFSPSELSLLHDDPLYPRVPYPETKTIYPPASQIIFFLSYNLFGASAFGLKIFYLLFEAGIIIFLYQTLKLIKINSNYILLYAFSPLVIFEFFINAHIDVLILFFIVGSIYFAIKKNVNLSMLFLGLSVMCKVYSLILLPVYMIYFFRRRTDTSAFFLSTVFFIVPFSLLLFYSDGIYNIFSQFSYYLKFWQFNNLPFTAINYFLELFGIRSFTTVRAILLVLFFCSYVYILFSKLNLIPKIYLTLFTYLFFSSTVHPWYLTVLVLLLPLQFNFSVYYWSGIIVLTNISVYYYLKDKEWFDITAVLLVQYIMLIIFLIYDFKNIKSKITHAQIE